MPQLDSITFSLQVGLFFWLFWSLYIIVVVLKLPQYLLVYYTKNYYVRKFLFLFVLGVIMGFILIFLNKPIFYADSHIIYYQDSGDYDVGFYYDDYFTYNYIYIDEFKNNNIKYNTLDQLFNSFLDFFSTFFSFFYNNSNSNTSVDLLKQSHLLEKTELLERISSLKNQNKEINELNLNYKNKIEIFDDLLNLIKKRSEELDYLNSEGYISFFISDFYEKILKTHPEFDETLEKIKTLGPESELGPEFINRFISCLTEEAMAPLLTEEDIGKVAGALYNKQIDDIEKNYEEIFITHIDAIEEQYFS